MKDPVAKPIRWGFVLLCVVVLVLVVFFVLVLVPVPLFLVLVCMRVDGAIGVGVGADVAVSLLTDLAALKNVCVALRWEPALSSHFDMMI